MRVIFPDAASQRLFSTEAMLDRRFGNELAGRVRLRLLILRAAPDLSKVPTRAPFSLRKVARNRFVLDVDPPLVMRIGTDGAAETELSQIRTVTILSVE